jgi:hypothetical protein
VTVLHCSVAVLGVVIHGGLPPARAAGTICATDDRATPFNMMSTDVRLNVALTSHIRLRPTPAGRS